MQDAAVLVPVYRSHDAKLRMLLVRRSAWGVHGGQIAFPGGKTDPQDISMQATALREAYEEIGLVHSAAYILEELPTVESPATGFRVVPFLARISPVGPLQKSEREIAEILDLEVAALADPARKGTATEQFPHRPEPITFSFLSIGPYRLWGLTYRIVYPLLPRLLRGEWDI